MNRHTAIQLAETADTGRTVAVIAASHPDRAAAFDLLAEQASRISGTTVRRTVEQETITYPSGGVVRLFSARQLTATHGYTADLVYLDTDHDAEAESVARLMTRSVGGRVVH